MTLTFQEELEVKVVSQAGQVAVEFLRACQNVTAKETITAYNRIFKEVYEATAKIITDNQAAQQEVAHFVIQ